MLSILWTLLSFVVALGILVAIHEFGHFWVARRCGVTVQRFSIGFGKVLWRKVGQDGTEYVIAAIPLGGYVKMLDERVDEVSADQLEGAFNRKPVLSRIAIVAAGPIANFIFAIFAFWLMYLIGVSAVKPIVGEIKPQSIAAVAGIEQGQEIVAINGDATEHWQEVNLALVGLIGNTEATITVTEPGRSATIVKRLDLSKWDFDPETQGPVRSLGLVPFYPEPTKVLAGVEAGSPADLAGLMVGDTLVTLNGVKIERWQEFVTLIQQSHGTSSTLTYQRNGNTFSTTLVPQKKQTADGRIYGYAGVTPTATPWPEQYQITYDLGPIDALVVGAEKTWQLMDLSIAMLGKLLTGDISVKNLSGPISIAQGAGQSASYGVVAFLGFLALISVNLGIINLLPLPVLDGGHLMYYFIELLTGKPVPEKIQEVGFRIGAALLFMLMSIAIFNDFTRL
ncbi:sigma E protease regulator RseP [Psychrobium sp. 1_MG-2023]|uniref:sigma E protease regulator RseP n=1 Tax=Psychrobium sp. 1_MG-2023 TaxID=3062624 RepID=UPI000C3293CA|nr:sigma E protease regulator RseP [Psychrobium sp. 1_MG-2023]MDP2559989.1 sigma E protease regulator RseP [Psychrobium sp. 1_MG-2023]PKF56349.1 zinc metallopeptidase RseP [Alteromonadales bacterium alter-6D02]